MCIYIYIFIEVNNAMQGYFCTVEQLKLEQVYSEGPAVNLRRRFHTQPFVRFAGFALPTDASLNILAEPL